LAQRFEILPKVYRHLKTVNLTSNLTSSFNENKFIQYSTSSKFDTKATCLAKYVMAWLFYAYKTGIHEKFIITAMMFYGFCKDRRARIDHDIIENTMIANREKTDDLV